MAFVDTFFSGTSATCDLTQVAAGAAPILVGFLPKSRTAMLHFIRASIKEMIETLDQLRPVVEESGTTQHLRLFVMSEKQCRDLQQKYDKILEEHQSSKSWKNVFIWNDKLREQIAELCDTALNRRDKVISASLQLQLELGPAKSPRIQACMQSLLAQAADNAIIDENASATEHPAQHVLIVVPDSPTETVSTDTTPDISTTTPLYKNDWNMSRMSCSSVWKY
ncbi:hypothetical protein BT96DRAFT_1026470 [Gymnopus androsaceus JB14]|uniref:Uncharacterized protein n=1 Tax=Gymnopus androsaceus JB14 TaxID=1447944 RepID=A0A6A4GKC6_9AGAR|nr:hypothetical protein BT96DRAFT_1026470 [Gymnopus androsaceus JB14]